jgi:glyoxylase-like metal-dependent hydrolase (beta-lactamase superfamily II)
MIIESLIVNEMETNCYILGCEETKEGVVIDPGGEAEKIKERIDTLELKIKYIINTHGHIDHIAANKEIKESEEGNKPLICVHQEDAEMLTRSQKNLSPSPDILLKNGDKLEVGTLILEIVHTPGHTKGGICLKTEDKIFTGDSLFAGGIGRTDFPGGDLKTLLNSIKKKLLILDEKIKIYPGHGPPSTLGLEKRNNPWLRA